MSLEREARSSYTIYYHRHRLFLYIHSTHDLPNNIMYCMCTQMLWERIDRPVTTVNFLRILTTRHPLPNFRTTLIPPSLRRWVTKPRGQKITPSPLFKPEIRSNASNLLESSSNAMSRLRWPHHRGELKRWQITVEHSPNMLSGTTVGSCVDMMVRIPRCLCCLITESKVSVNGVLSFVRYCVVNL